MITYTKLKDVAEEFQLNHFLLRSWIKRKLITAHKTMTGKIVFTPEDIEELRTKLNTLEVA